VNVTVGSPTVYYRGYRKITITAIFSGFSKSIHPIARQNVTTGQTAFFHIPNHSLFATIPLLDINPQTNQYITITYFEKYKQYDECWQFRQ
jgi:hypothetical protein